MYERFRCKSCTHFRAPAGDRLNSLFFPSSSPLKPLPVAAALGMGYYTAQVIGYILDVCWENTAAQKNPIRLFLFVCFFPQLTVGPISRYNDLKVLYEKHRFSYMNICMGSQRILWGFFKKLVVCERVSLLVSSIWADTAAYNGIWPWIAVLLYPMQIYTDFSGCMDIILGAAELFDIHLAENFRNPFFARTTQEFWQRWHITLGGWARDYVFYPFMKSRRMVNFGRKCKKELGKHWGKFIPWTVSMMVLWFVMGFWHGSIQHIFGVSLWFFSIQFVSELFKPVTRKLTTGLEMKTESFSWHLFQSVRTYLIYALGIVFFSTDNLQDAFLHYRILWKSAGELNPWTLFDNTIEGLVSRLDLHLIVIGFLFILIVAVLREKFTYARYWVREQSVGFRWLIWIVLFFLVLIFGYYGPSYSASEFIYQGF